MPSKDSVRERFALDLNCSSRCRLLLCCCVSWGAGAASSETCTHSMDQTNVDHKKNKLSSWSVKIGRSKLGLYQSKMLLITSGKWIWRCAGHTCLLLSREECWWAFCFSSYIFLREAITSSFSSWSLLGRARWTHKSKIQI